MNKDVQILHKISISGPARHLHVVKGSNICIIFIKIMLLSLYNTVYKILLHKLTQI